MVSQEYGQSWQNTEGITNTNSSFNLCMW